MMVTGIMLHWLHQLEAGSGTGGAAHSTPASFFSLSSSSSTDLSTTPPLRTAGSETDRTVMRGLRSTPVSSALIASMGFFLACGGKRAVGAGVLQTRWMQTGGLGHLAC